MRQSASFRGSLIKLAIFTATRWEYQSVQEAFTIEQATIIEGVPCTIGHRSNASIFLFQTGVGPQHAFEVSRSVLVKGPWNLVVSSGFAGALVPCAIGTIVVGHEVLMDDSDYFVDPLDRSPIVCDETFQEEASQIACFIDTASLSGHIVTLPRIVGEASEKKYIAARTQAIAIDMESGILGYVAHAQNIPFIVVRTISDLVDEDLPIDFNLFLRPRSWVKGVGQVIGRPASLRQLPRLRRQMQQASWKLTKFFLKFFDEIDRVNEQPVR